eukprot:TRINITY_DN11114_c0_g1_i1.p1 TRINITY_DN11114_c0_g1~~TRINITY_DN11114_c0_g1_i1.p1  ORF type:complete len:301 (-),score=48.52 TRINITY_DN11114_c0_g1_i1:680-1582(-)
MGILQSSLDIPAQLAAKLLVPLESPAPLAEFLLLRRDTAGHVIRMLLPSDARKLTQACLAGWYAVEMARKDKRCLGQWILRLQVSRSLVGHSRTVQSLISTTGEWRDLGWPGWAMCGHDYACLGVGGRLYAMSSSSVQDRYYSQVGVFDPVARVWNDATWSLHYSRCYHTWTELGGVVYGIGGVGPGGRRLKSVEMLCTRSGEWAQAADMMTARYHHTCTVLDGKLYVVGGRDCDGRLLDSVEIYDPATDRWSLGPELNSVRCNHASAVLGGRLFVVAGYGDGFWRLSSVEVFQPGWSSW